MDMGEAERLHRDGEEPFVFSNKKVPTILKPARIMSKKVLYITGGIFAFFILSTIISPSQPPEQKIAQENTVVQTNNITETTPENSVEPKAIEENEKIVKQGPSNEIGETPVVTETQYTYYSVVDVVDGDTIKINLNGVIETLRLIGIDTPETVDPRKPVQCFGKEASNKAKELLSGQKVRIEKDSTQGERDKYGRLLVYVYRDDGLFYNKYIIEQGYAHEYTYDTPYKYQAEFKSAEKYARENQLGLWSPNTCNGNTTSESSSSAQTTTQTTGKYYTSSYITSKYYYPESCSTWQGLSSKYLKVFDSLETLLTAYPSRTLSPQCQ